MKSLTDSELKKLAITPGSKQYLAFDELARRIRENPSGWDQQEPWVPWDARVPNAIEMEWAFLKWSQRLNDENPELEQEQQARLDELERHLDQDPDSIEIKYHNAVGEELRRERVDAA